MKKKILSAILSFAMLFSVVASLGTITASAALSDGIVWEKIYDEAMEEYPDKIDSGEGPVDQLYEIGGYPGDSSWISGNGKTWNNGDGTQALKLGGPKNATRYADLIVGESPLYGNSKNTKVRVSFDIATDRGAGAYIILVGTKDGEVVQTTAGDSGRFIFTSSNCFNFETQIKSYSTNTWYNMVIDLDCATQKYDVYVNDELVAEAEDFPKAYDTIYGVSFAAKGSSSAATNVYIDNLRYYTVGSAVEVVKSNVTLNANGGEINSGNVTEYIEGVGATLPTDVTKDGFGFAGWYDNPSFTGKAVTEISEEATGDKTYYAKWLAVYSVTLNANGGIINGNITEYTEGEDVTLPEVTRAGYTFLGWYNNAECTGNAVEKVTAPTGDLTYYAKWEKLPFIADGVEWNQIFEEKMDEYPDQFDSGKGSVEKYYEIGGYPSDTSWITTAAASFDKSAVSEYSGWSLRLGGPSNAVRYADMILEESPLYNNPNNKKVRVEFEFATDKDAGMYVILEGEKDGEHVRTTAGDSGRFIFTSNGCLNFETAIKGYTKNYMHKMVIDLDCATQKYDVYLDGNMVAYSQDFPMAMDSIYGVSFASKGSSSSTLVFLENLRYYTTNLPEGLEFKTVEAYYIDGEVFYCDALVEGYVANASDVYILLAIYNSKDEYLYSVKVPYANYNGSVETTVEGLEDVSYVKAFAWNMKNLVPLGSSVKADIEN